MPLLRRQPFQRGKPPPDLHPDEEVFHCKLTNEIFRDYEKFFERIILCNSLVWSCAITGRSGLTYQEAEESEEKALKQLASFPAYLQKPILYLVTKTQRSRLADLNDDIFSFAKDRYFIGEMVEVLTGSTRKTCKVLNVLLPGSSKPGSPAAAVNSDPLAAVADGPSTSNPDKRLAKKLGKPENYQYVVQEPGKTNTLNVKFKMISRKKGLFTRDKCKLFLKQSCDSLDGIWRVKEAKAKKFDLKSARYEEIFVGPLPQFEFSEIKMKKPKKPESKEASPAPQPKKQKEKSAEKEDKKPPVLTLEEIRMLKEQERLIREKEKGEKLALKMKEREELRKKFEEEKERKRQEKALEMEKKREERRIQAELWKEWSRFRDDLECDDLKVMPEPTPVKCRIPVEEFGDAIMVVEFVNCFSSIFDLKSSFPKGFTLRTLEEALLETDAGGLMADLLLMMLTAIFSLQEEEEEEEAELQKEEKKEQAETVLDEKACASDMSVNQLIDAATTMSHLPLLTHGSTLKKLPLDNFTLTEILRLHILASGAQGNQANAKFRYQQRGGYMPIDDAGLDFKRRAPEIVSKLAVENVYDISPSYKLQILKVLVDQFLTYAASRDLIEENYEKLKQLRTDLKQLQWGEQRREREEVANRSRIRYEEKQKERDILEKRRLLRIKQRDEQLMKEAAAKNGGEPGQEPMDVTLPGSSIEVTEEEILELEASLPTQEEREKRQKDEDDEEADRKAEYMMKERDFLENILALQHGNAIYPVGRDRMYRRYWVFKSVPGLFVEDDEEFVSEEALKPFSQNPDGSAFDLANPFAMPPKLQMSKQPTEPQQPQRTTESKEGSDKENDSMNASSINNSALNDSTASQNRQSLTNSANANVVGSANNSVAGNETPTVKNGDTKQEDMIVISDDEDSNKLPTLERENTFQPPEFIETPAITQMKGEKHKWAFFKTEEELELLINCLNGRGIREKALKSALLEHKNVLMEKISEVPEDLLTIPDEEEDDAKDDVTMSPQLKTREWRRGRRNVTGTVKNDSAHEGLELNLRELILDLEERIHVGSLGWIRVKDRGAWRDAIENGSYDPQSDDPAFIKENHAVKKSDGSEAKDMDSSSEEENSNIAISQDMAKAIVQIARGIERRFLNPPLGDEEKPKPTKKAETSKKDDQKKGKKKDNKEDSDESDGEDNDTSTVPQKTVLERWEEACLLCTGLAQVFLHLSSLEKSVIWAKSLLHTRCRICRRKCDPDKLLLCDQCDKGHHLYCLKPPLKQVPTGDWFCPECKPKALKRSPVKKRRRTFSEHPSSDEEEEKEEESSEEEAEDEASSEEDNDPMCAVCSKTGKLICCDNCPLSYHLACADPPLKKVPKGKWLCQVCAFTDTKAGKIKMNLVKGGKKKNSPKTTPSSSKQSSRRGSPRDSPLTVEVTKKRKRADSPLLQVQDKMKLKRNAKSASKLTLEVKNDEPKHYTSSSRGNSKVQQLKMLEDMVIRMIDEEEAWPFLRPVQKKDAPDYFEVIKKPMDFQTIKNKINKFVYTEPAELVTDVRLIFTNCIEYNKRTTPEFKAGANLSKAFEKKLKNLWETAESNGPSAKRARTK